MIPSDTQEKNVHNYNATLQYLKLAGVPLSDEDAVWLLLKMLPLGDGELILSLLWNIFVRLQKESADHKSAKVIGFASSFISALNGAELSITEPKESSIVHMDVDQSFLPIPSAVKASIFESFARQNMVESETDVRSGIQQLVENIYGFPPVKSSEIMYGDSTFILFNKLILCCIQEGGTLLFPAGTNGNYVSAAKFSKANIMTIPTQIEEGFKLSGKILMTALKSVSRPWVYVSGPTVNPTGLLYSNEEIQDILSVCAEVGARVIIDTSFSGLEFSVEGWAKWSLHDSLSGMKSLNSSFCISLLGGLSFELLTGGLNFGFLILDEPNLIDTFYTFPSLSRPHSTIKYAIKRLLGLKEQKAGNLSEAIAKHKEILRNRSAQLMETLESCGWDVIGCNGGVSLVAKPSAYLGKTLKLEDSELKLNDLNIREAILRATGLCINSCSWTGIPGHCRLTIALEEGEFERALQCIIRFKELVLGS